MWVDIFSSGNMKQKFIEKSILIVEYKYKNPAC